MPIFGLGLHVLVAIYFAVHALRHGQNMYWLFVLFAFPLLGSIVYFIVIYLPALQQSRGGVAAKRALRQLVDPQRALREARQAFELTPTLDKRLRLAEALLQNRAASEALALYREVANGPFARDPALLAGLAEAEFETGATDAAYATLQRLFEAKPDARRQPETALLYARALGVRQQTEARDAFEAALVVASGPEAKCRYADWLQQQGQDADKQRAAGLYQEVVQDSRHWHSHARSINKPWLNHAQSALSQAGWQP
ncbi:hypothetical protein [Chitinimonas sp.]|uniref:hypothetical protein n=1 Tax=Chitinimonas sp. TaxID=1934313 RepID=UPI002F927B33